ncbi:tetratricopeptide repeat protein, partial [Candidatus Dependentiae bacterium]|nr:tetratricopeptide repeat protein [Candidatus Dependentiae bacterium]
NKLVLLRDGHITDLSEKIDSTSSKQKENEIRILEAEKEISGYKNKVAELYETVKMKDLEVNSIIKDKYDLIEKIDKMTKNENMGSNILKNTNLSKTNNQNDDNKKIDERQLLSSKYDYLKQLLSESISLFKNNDYDNALLKLEEALSIDKNNDEVCFNIAAVYYAQKKYEHALDFIDKAILINPSNIENKIYKAAMLVKMQDKIEFNKFIKTLNEKEIQHNKISYYIKLMR